MTSSPEARPRVLVLAGRGRYEDPWHDHAATSHLLARLFEAHGLEATVASLFPSTAELIAARTHDLLVVNGGTGRVDPEFDGTDEDWQPFHRALHDHVFSGAPLLVHHQGINAFLDDPAWPRIIGGRWVRGTTYHPPRSPALFRVIPSAHPLTEGLADIPVDDERYTLLAPEDGVVVTTTQLEAGIEHPTSWVNTAGGVRTVYDSLGHDARAFESPERVALLLHEVNWLLGRPLDA